MKKNAFFTFVCACVPGFGQMYQGYMKRGASLLFWAVAAVGLCGLLRSVLPACILPLIWAYSFFDTFNIRALSPEQRAAFGDGFIPNVGHFTKADMGDKMKRVRLSKLVGWGLIALGGVMVYAMVWDIVYRYAYYFSPVLAEWMNRLPGLVIAAVVVLLGVRLLGRSRRADEEAGRQIPQCGGEEPEHEQ